MGSNTPQWTPQSGKLYPSARLFKSRAETTNVLSPPVLSTVPHPPEENTTSPIPFFHLLERLKTTKREGWRRFGINGESISDHMYRMSIMTMFAPPELASRLNIPHCTKMALIHDMAESLVGDITPVDKDVTKTEKARREADTMDYITETLLGKIPGGALSAQEIKRVFHEYEDNVTLEAQFVHDIDKMELLLQMVEYERTHEVDLSEFTRVASRVQLPEIKVWAEQVMAERPKRA
ncbi:HD domain-containing protein [Penicillium diatomitis]|uniref:5'-deoxynucleotidase n=1 Tax=Penicillium diatomitis TaxID=2819901 RepID=A0A9X0BU92_9EURO|nr:HD domain-containing protein [Penicillium diatomitis]KAJ5484075.1 HD domain-containing protein [Penicillium diatomitis]